MSLIKRGKYWSYNFYINKNRYQGSTKLSDKIAAQAIEDQLKVQIREKYSIESVFEQTKRKLMKINKLPFTADAIINEFKLYSTSESCRANYSQVRLRRFFDAMVKIGINDYSDITETVALEYFKTLHGANATKNDYLSTLDFVFERSHLKFGLLENPFRNIKKLKKKQQTREVFTPDELKVMWDNATGDMRDLIITCVSTGLRKGDVCNLKKEYIKGHWLQLPAASKTGKELKIPLMKSLYNHLMSIRNYIDSEYLFPRLRDKYNRDPSIISKEFKQLLSDIGITNAVKSVNGYSKKVSIKDIHSLRHTFVYLAAVNKFPLPLIQSIVQHCTPEMTKIYMDHCGEEEKQKYFNQMPNYLGVN